MRASADEAWAKGPSYKFVVPMPIAGGIRREGILQRIASHEHLHLVVLQAPAGHGKSTALQQIKEVADEEGYLTGWLTFDAGDNDPRRFFMHFQSLLVRTIGAVGKGETRRGQVGASYRCDWLFEHLDRLEKPVALFLDDFHALSDKTVLSFFRLLFERAPEKLRIYLGSRSLPDVGLTRLIVNNRAVILQADDLRFSPQEVECFFAGAADSLIQVDEIDAIYRRTEGWPAALQLFKLTLNSADVRRSLTGDDVRAPRELAEYLAENVLALQPPRIQDLLLRTAELTRLNGPLCNELLERTDSAEVLLQLEKSGMFLRCVDPRGGWFKYHPLFSSILADQQRGRDPEAVAATHRRAAGWYMKHRLYEETVHHATLCGEYSLAADALNLWSSSLIANAHLLTVERWSERIPFEEIARRRDLAIKCTYALVFLRRRQRVKPLLELLQSWSGTGNVLETTDPHVVLSMAAISANDDERAFALTAKVPLDRLDAEGFAAFELGACANLRGYCALSAQESEWAREYLALARVHNDHAAAAFSRAYTIAVNGVALLLRGALTEALEKFREGLQGHPVMENSFAFAALISCYVWALYEANDLETAQRLFEQNHDIISESTLPDFLAVAYLSSARVHDARGRHAKAESLLEEAEAIGRSSGWYRLVEAVSAERVRRALLGGLVDVATSVAGCMCAARDSGGSQWIPFGNDVEDRQLCAIRVALATSRLDAAYELIQGELKRQRDRVLRQVKLYLLLALHGARGGDCTAAQRNLCTALKLARPGGFIRPILDEGEQILQLLRDRYQILLESDPGASRPDPVREFVAKLLEASGTDLGRTAGRLHFAVQPLTEREREMLTMLANGTSNREMAQQLFVSENTVKFHLKNIYAKLSVASRVQAISTARQFGIIH
ncbi:MAG: LuxR family transcriptional regulator [Gammaproteobacteria bacterium]|nr:LuxR family transcriptional regulator [Gammaproteobacteria bacterium]